ncbi:TonB-dependent receptor [Sphingomonas sp. DBB INV C78]|uniref:TonB-dependent receptor n=1 Tax=Sphingomonas sp. DBB INV C78 TaxID=3349434 RepID=UPI0036D334A0
MKTRYQISSAAIAITLALLSASYAQAQTADASAEDIVVTGQRAQQERAIAAKRDAIGVTDVVAADEIGRLPDRNVAEVVERLPGVGVTYDQGEGRYVAIRGVPSDLNGYTVNGIEIGNPDGQTRSLPLDVISGQLLNRVEVAKVKTADMDGQGIGGSINLVTQTAFDFRDPFALTINAQAGYQELNDKVPIRGDVSIAKRFGADEQFGVTLGASYSDRTFTSYGFYPDDWRPVEGAARGGMPINTKLTDYSLKRERIGATGSFDWRPSDDHQFYIRGIYSKFTEDEYRQRYRLDFATDALIASPNFTLNPDGESGTVTGTPNVGTGPERRQDLRQEHKEKSVLAGMIGGSSRFDALKLDYVLARVHNEVREPNQLWQFRCNPGTVDFDFSDKIFSATPRTECDASQMNFRQYTEQNERGDEDIWQGRVDATYDLAGLSDGSFLKLGGKYRTTDKDFDSSNDTWTRGSSANRFTLAQYDLAGDPVFVSPQDGKPFLISPTIDLDKIRAFTAENLSSALFVKDNATSLSNATLNDFVVDEDITAAYAMANLRFGAVTITPGLRFEHTKLKVTGFRLEEGTTVVPATSSNSYDDWLPSLIVRIEPSSDTVFRLAYSRSLGRPNYSQLSPGGSVSYEDGATPGTFEGSVSLGNSDLKPYRADNLDASAEWYFAKGGLISVGVFAKFIKNPIFTQSYTLNNVTFDGRLYDVLDFSQPLNADKGDIVGIEAAYQQQFTFLPGLLSGFGVELTGTLVNSTLRLPDGRSSSFPSQSDFLFGAQLFYQKGIVEASIAYHNTGKALLSAGDLSYQDQYNDDLRRLDAKVSVEVMPNIRLFAEAQNLTDEPTRQYQGGGRDWIIQNERYGRTFYGGISAKF